MSNSTNSFIITPDGKIQFVTIEQGNETIIVKNDGNGNFTVEKEQKNDSNIDPNTTKVSGPGDQPPLPTSTGEQNNTASLSLSSSSGNTVNNELITGSLDSQLAEALKL